MPHYLSLELVSQVLAPLMKLMEHPKYAPLLVPLTCQSSNGATDEALKEHVKMFYGVAC